jgi:hypothetical protein
MSIYKALKDSLANTATTMPFRTGNPMLGSLYDMYKAGSGAWGALTGTNKPASTPSPQMASRMNTMVKTQAPFGSFLSYYNSPISSTQKDVANDNSNSQYTPPTTITSYYSNPTPTTNKPIDDRTTTQQTQTPTTNTDQNQSNYSTPQNTPANNDFDFEAMRKKLGLKDSPVYTPPDMSKYDADYEQMRQQQQQREAEIQRNLDAELSAISQRYEGERKKAAEQTENERQNQLSNLYSVGVVNPASSGVSSIGTASQKVLAKPYQ